LSAPASTFNPRRVRPEPRVLGSSSSLSSALARVNHARAARRRSRRALQRNLPQYPAASTFNPKRWRPELRVLGSASSRSSALARVNLARAARRRSRRALQRNLPQYPAASTFNPKRWRPELRVLGSASSRSSALARVNLARAARRRSLRALHRNLPPYPAASTFNPKRWRPELRVLGSASSRSSALARVNLARAARRRSRRALQRNLPQYPAASTFNPKRWRPELRVLGSASSRSSALARVNLARAARRRSRRALQRNLPQYHPMGCSFRLMCTCFTCRYSSAPHGPSSLPMPLIL